MNKEIKTKKTKVCGKCNRELPIDNFSKNKAQKDGLQGYWKECSSKYYQTYNQTHNRSQYLNQYNKEYKNQFKGYYLYIILDKQDNIIYVGQTSNFYTRLINHLSENVNSTKEFFANNEWGCIKYLDVSNFVENEMELKSLENKLIELYEPRCNTHLNIIRDVDRNRLFSLLAQLHSILNEWIVFRTNN